jgi:class 3 adenylate cyclase/tetratricopeptide (TPR) repeat protein
MDVGGWLRGLGLGQYEEKFRDNKIDADLLPRLTVDDLKDIGVSVVGDRRRLLDAIAVIAGAGPASPAKSTPSKGLQAPAERRPITVMFCDLVGSTSLAAKLDAEDWRTLVSAYLDEASAAVTGFGGHVLKKLGDGLMALFGYPHAQENDAERAVRAALAIQRALVEINARNASKGAPELSARVGIETGPVVVEASGEVFGDAPNVAARVEAEAEPGSVLITLNVQRQVAGLFVAEELGARELKGVSDPVQLFRIVRASGGRRRGGARALTPCVGRDEELSTLAHRWDRARAGEGQLVLIVGEPGLGKSRLIEEFHVGLEETPHTWVEWSASQLLQNTPLHSIAEWGRLRFGADASAEQRFADLEGTLRLIGLDPAEHAPLLAPLVDIPLPPGRATNCPPEELRRRQLAAMTAWVLAGARSQPVVLAIEDLHWADPTLLDLLRAFADRGAQAPLLVLATTRPEFRAPWSLRSHHSVISLRPLDRTGVARMVGEISARHALSKEVIEGVNERTGGVPLFVEEVTRLLLERGEQGGVQAIPPTLQQSLAARLDRLGPAREVAQIGAVLGRDFAYSVLLDVAEIDESALKASLERLAEADLLFVEGAPPQANYRFKHALIQDAAYDSLLKSRRQALHRRAAELLRDQPERAAAEPEVIAHHFTEAAHDDLAIEWWGRAGDQALRRSAFQEAIAHLGKAIAMADKAGSTARRSIGGSAVPNRRLTQLHVAHGNALIAARGFGAAETAEAFAKARDSAAGGKDAPERLAADYGLWAGDFVRGELPSMRAHSAAFLGDVEARPDSPEAGVAHRAVGITCWVAGEYREARDHLERALALFQPGRDDDLAFRFGPDAGVLAMLYLALTLWPMGDIARAVSLVGRAEARIADLTHVGTLAPGRMHAAMFDLMRRDRVRVAPNAFELTRLAREFDLNLFRAFSVFLEGWASTASGASGSGLEGMRRGLELLREQNVLWFDGLLKMALAEAEAQWGDAGRAVAIFNETLATCDRTGCRAFEAELHRTRGDILLKRDPANPAPAEEAFLTAITIAKQQTTRSFGLRAALALAKLHRSTDRSVEAHDILAPALEGFSPTPEMPEIAEAQALLAALTETDEVKAAIAQRERRVHLQTSYSQAMMFSKGYDAKETKVAFARAAELATRSSDFSERFGVANGQWTTAFMRCEFRTAGELASAFLREAEDLGRLVEVGVARRSLALISYFVGNFLEARTHCEKALDACNPERDREARERFTDDTGTQALSCLGATSWQLGEVQHARELIDAATRRVTEPGHFPSMALSLSWRWFIENKRGDAAAALNAAEALAVLGREHGLSYWRALGEVQAAWARGRLIDPTARVAEFRRALGAFADQGTRVGVPFYDALLAQLEVETLGPAVALERIENALALADRVEFRCELSFMHRIRGDILCKFDPADPASQEDAYRRAIIIANEQGARSPQLLASLALAKLYQATGRPADAHAVLAPALEGFSLTPEMPEIAEAQTLLAALADIEPVREALEKRQARAKMHLDYARAVQWAKGWGSEEARAAVERAHEFAAPTPGHPDYWSLAYGRFAVALLRGEFHAALEIAETYLRQAQVEGRPDHAVNARRLLGTVKLELGAFPESRQEFEKLLEDWDEDRDRGLRAVTGADVLCVGWAYMAQLMVILGEVDDAVRMSEGAIRRAESLGDFGSLAFASGLSLFVLAMCGRTEATLRRAEAFEAKALEKGARLWESIAREWASWARGLITGDAAGAATEYRDSMATRRERQERQGAYLGNGLLAQLQGKAGVIDAALASIAEGLALAEQTGGHRADSFLHRVRGDVLAERDPAVVEAAYREAVRIAQNQGARTFELQASHALAKLYQSTGRPADAHDVLSPALEGFTPTPEMPEIAEAQALLAAIDPARM